MGLLDFALSGILNDPAQYRGDGKLLRARGLLRPEERPTVTVEAQDPGFVMGYSDVKSRKDGKPLPIRLRREAGMSVPLPGRDRIIVNRESQDYRNKDLRYLAAQLAHEQRHVLGEGENEAYPVQMEVLRRLRVVDPQIHQHLARQMALYGEK